MKDRYKSLGVPFGTINAKLRKAIMFKMAKALNLTACHRCGDHIETIEEFSIDHKIPWEHSDDPAGLFLDLDNIAFSHLRCNIGAARKPNQVYFDRSEKNREDFKKYYAKNGAEWNKRRNERRRKKEIPTRV